MSWDSSLVDLVHAINHTVTLISKSDRTIFNSMGC